MQTVWKNWAPSKCKFFAWHVINNRGWMAVQLQRRGWPNCNLCPLCKHVQELAAHLLFQCRYTARVWGFSKVWLGLHDINLLEWGHMNSVKDWFSLNVTWKTQPEGRSSPSCYSFRGKYGMNRTQRVFHNMVVPVEVIVAKIKVEYILWYLARVKHFHQDQRGV